MKLPSNNMAVFIESQECVKATCIQFDETSGVVLAMSKDGFYHAELIKQVDGTEIINRIVLSAQELEGLVEIKALLDKCI